jgi:hypothetical protein
MNNIKYEKLCTPIIFYGGLIYYLSKVAAGEVLLGASFAIALQAFITVINDRDTTAALFAAECLFFALVAFILS